MTEKRKEFLSQLGNNEEAKSTVKPVDKTDGDKIFAAMYMSESSRKKYAIAKTQEEKEEAEKLIKESKDYARE